MAIGITLARRFMRGHGGRLALTVLALASGVALVGAIDLVNGAVLRGFATVIDDMAGRAALQVRVDSGFFAEDLAERVAAVPGVERAVPVVVAAAFTTDDPPRAMTIHGFDLTDPDTVRIYEPADAATAIVADPLEFLNSRDAIIVTREFAAASGLGEGATLLLDTPHGRQPFRVRGVIDPSGIGRAFGGSLILMDLQAAEARFAAPGMVNRIDVVVAPAADVGAVAHAVQAALPTGLRVDTAAQRKADLHAVLRTLQAFLYGVSLVALGAAALIAFNGVNAIFDARERQLGVLRAVGVRRAAVWRELLTESLLLGLAGVALGLPGGVVLGRTMLPLVAETVALNFRTVAPPAELALRPAALLLAAALGLGAALLAALAPGWRAARRDAAEVLRGSGQRRGDVGWRWRLGLPLVVAAALALSVATIPPRPGLTHGLVSTALLMILTGMLAMPLVAALPLVARLPLPPTLRLAVANCAAAPHRTALTLATVGIGLGCVLWLGLVAASFEVSVVRVFEQSMRADLVVSSAHIGEGALEAPIDEGIGDALRRVDGVAAVVGVRLATAAFRGESIVLDAFDPTYFLTPSFGEWPLLGARLPDAWRRVADGTAVVISSNFARHFGVGLGDALRFETPSGPLTVAVAGVTTDFASPRGTVEMSRTLFARYWHDARVTRFFVHLTPGSRRAEVEPAIRQDLAARGRAWRIISSGELVAYFRGQIRRAFASLYGLALIILTVILFGIADTLGAGVSERTREIGMLRVLGIRRARVGGIVVLEALVVGGLGLLLAAAAALAMSALWIGAIIPGLLGWVIELHVPFAFAAALALGALAIAAVAALLPAQRAARLQPAAALRAD